MIEIVLWLKERGGAGPRDNWEDTWFQSLLDVCNKWKINMGMLIINIINDFYVF